MFDSPAGALGATELRRLGLVTGHAYSILDLYTTPGRAEHLIRLRNPWAEGRGDGSSGMWAGPWRDGGREWDSEPGLREKCSPCLQEQGVFWMSLADFVRFFRRVDAAKLYEAGRSVVRVRVPLPRWTDTAGAAVYAVRVDVARTTSVDVCLHQQPQGAARRVEPSGLIAFSRDPASFTRDLGVAVVVEGRGAGAQPEQVATGLQYALGSERRVDARVECEGMLDGPATYWVVPVTLNRYWDASVGTGGHTGMRDDADADFVVVEIRSAHPMASVSVVQVRSVRVHRCGVYGCDGSSSSDCSLMGVLLSSVGCNEPLFARTAHVQRDVGWYRRVLLCQTIAEGAREDSRSKGAPSSGTKVIYTMSEDAGARFVLVNWAPDRSVSVTLRLSELRGLLHSRGPVAKEAAEVATNDALPPRVGLGMRISCPTGELRLGLAARNSDAASLAASGVRL